MKKDVKNYFTSGGLELWTDFFVRIHLQANMVVEDIEIFFNHTGSPRRSFLNGYKVMPRQ